MKKVFRIEEPFSFLIQQTQYKISLLSDYVMKDRVKFLMLMQSIKAFYFDYRNEMSMIWG